MPYNADDCSELCWPHGAVISDDVPDENHARCEADLLDFSDPRKEWAYCACVCHEKPELPGYTEHTAGLYVTRGAYERAQRVRAYEDRPGPLCGHRGVTAHLDS